MRARGGGRLQAAAAGEGGAGGVHRLLQCAVWLAAACGFQMGLTNADCFVTSAKESFVCEC
jgi:hypothetical protein